MEGIERNLQRILRGEAAQESQEFCDFTLREQNEATAAKGIITPSAPSEFHPVLKKNVCYIVMAVLINDSGEVLMMQEAKSSCAGQWYLPAGRMEPQESIQVAAKREVKEETGLDFEPTTLLMVESAGGAWFRFILTGEILGGKLKTPADANSESLQAKWVKELSELSLRAGDILPVIEKAREWHTHASIGSQKVNWHPCLLPTPKSHSRLLLRIACLVRKKSTNRVHLLVSEKTEAHIPTCEINPIRSIHSTLKKYMTEIFGADLPPHRPHGILSVEYDGRDVDRGDGLCLTLLVSIRCPLENAPLIDKYSWMELSEQTGLLLLGRLDKNMSVPLNVVRRVHMKQSRMEGDGIKPPRSSLSSSFSEPPLHLISLIPSVHCLSLFICPSPPFTVIFFPTTKMLRGLWRWYSSVLKRHPLIVNCIQTSGIMACGDVIAQVMVEKCHAKNINWGRTERFAILGTFLVVPMIRTWYLTLDRFIVGGRQVSIALRKMVCDQGLFAPFFLVVFLATVEVLKPTRMTSNHESALSSQWLAIKRKLEEEYFDVIKVNWLLWPSVQLGNFYLVPLQYRILVVQVVALFWNTYLAWKANN